MTKPQSTTQTKAHVLLVEDSRVEAAIVKALLQENGEMNVSHVGSLHDAINAMTIKRYDAIVLDLNLPDSYGVDSAVVLKKRFPGTPIIVLSGNEEEVAFLRSLQYGAEGFLTKDQANSNEIRKSVFDAIFRHSLRKGAPL